MALLGVVAAAALGCPFDSLDPVTIVGRGTGGAGGGNGGAGGGGTGSGAIVVGSWRNVFATTTSVVDTRWSFTSGGACSRTVITTPLAGGFETTSVQGCTYAVAGGSISIIFQGSSFVSTFSVAFAGGDLLLDGFRFRRFG